MRWFGRFGLATGAVVGGLGALVAASSSCSSTPTPGAPESSPAEDAATPDTRRPVDAAKDVQFDTAPPVVDAAALGDAAFPPGEWLPIPGLPASCAARVAKDPRVSVSRLPWQPCANGRAACEVFLADWGRPNQRSFFPISIEPAFEDARGVHVSYTRDYGRYASEPQLRQSVVQLLHGEGEATWHSGAYCSPLVNASRHGLGMSVVFKEQPVTPDTPTQQFLGWSSWANPSQLELAEGVLTPALRVSQSLARGPGFLALESVNWGSSIVATAFRFADRDFARSTADNTLLSERPLPVADGYVSLVASTRPYAINFMPLTGGHTPVVQPSPGSDIVFQALDRANNDAFVWAEAPGGLESGWVLWTAPYTTNPAAVVKRRVAKLDFRYSIVANAGVVAAVISPTLARIVRLSDGLGWDIAPEPGLNFVIPLWVNDDSAWFVTWKPDAAAPQVVAFSGAGRFGRAGLGPPTVPSGF